jgi:TPP-dependent pyruvate/acetoin dehydrogenase alpha subunit
MNTFDYEKAYYLFLLIRKSEEKIVELYNTDKIKSPVHLSIGQESIAVGVSLALSINDIVFSNYRGHAHYIAKGGNFKKMWAELFGKSRGSARGKGGSMHINDWSNKIMTTSAIVATSIPEAVGFAYAKKYKNEKGIVVCYFGDGATEEGVFWESINFAALHNLPVIFVCENNQFAIYTHQSKRSAGETIAKKSESFGIISKKISSNDTKEIYTETHDIVSKISLKPQPYLLEIDTHRWYDHVGVGTSDEYNYRDKNEIKIAIENDNLESLKSNLNSQIIDQINKKVSLEINEAIHFAEKSDFPDENELLDNVYG